MDESWKLVAKLPEILHQYSTYSYPLLALLCIAGIALLIPPVWRKIKLGATLPVVNTTFGAALLFVSMGGLLLKYYGFYQEKLQTKEFLASNTAPDNEQWLLVFDFSLPIGLDAAQRNVYARRMQHFTDTISEVLLEDLPLGFRQPKIFRLPVDRSPWRFDGVNVQNYDQVITQLNAFAVMWGSVTSTQIPAAKAFLGLPKNIAKGIDTVIPLKDFSFAENPRREHQFGTGYYRLLGSVTMNMALHTFHKARQAAGKQRKKLYLQAAEQFVKARQAVNNLRDDAMLQRTLYSPKINKMIDLATTQGGFGP